jgi:hypothetical protein
VFSGLMRFVGGSSRASVWHPPRSVMKQDFRTRDQSTNRLALNYPRSFFTLKAGLAINKAWRSSATRGNCSDEATPKAFG